MRHRKDLSGMIFGKLTAKQPVGQRGHKTLWECICDCGAVMQTTTDMLTMGKTKSCGCSKGELNFYSRHGGKDPYIEQKYGRLTCIFRVDDFAVKHSDNKKRNTKYQFICDCGNIKEAPITDVLSKRIQSCGCLLSETSKDKWVDLTGQVFCYLTVTKRVENRRNKIHYECTCRCGNKKIVCGESLKDGHSRSCGCLKKSTGEYAVEECLKSCNVDYQYQYRHNSLKTYPFDFAVFQDGFLAGIIEFNGKQHYVQINRWERLEIIQQRDKKKADLCLKHSIPLLVIHYKDYKNITTIVESFLKDILFEEI